MLPESEIGLSQEVLHIISFDIPFPPDYGGVVEVFYKIKALSESGVKIYLHCFSEARSPSPVLSKLCEKVYYYPRRSVLASLPFIYPYMAYSRRSELLLKNLAAIQAPVLFEGIHTCFSLPFVKNTLRYPCFVRMHNDEPAYYKILAKTEYRYLQKAYFYWEANKIKDFEAVLTLANQIFTISLADTDYFLQRYPNTEYLPAFHPFDAVKGLSGRGEYALYHGNLSVIENHQAAMFLLKEVFSVIEYPLIIAGSNPRNALIRELLRYPHVQLVQRPDDETLNTLIKHAHIHLLPTFQATGIKLKLLNALFNGRWILANDYMTAQTGLESLCVLCQNPTDFITAIQNLQNKSFPKALVLEREQLLENLFSNRKNVEWLKNRLF